MAIGWHFFYEATNKIESQETDKPFTAEGYLRASTGPLAPKFRAMIPDADSRNLLEYERLTASWDKELERITTHYQFDEAQKAEAAKLLEASKAEAKAWFEDRDNKRKIADYFRDVEKVFPKEPETGLLAYEKELLNKKRREVEATRKELVATVEGWGKKLTSSVVALAKPDQSTVAGEYRPAPSAMAGLDALVMYGMLACGLCLMLGLLTPLAALGAAGYLAMFYFSMPPWPGLPPAPNAEGNYLYVNKNLIEMLACLALAATPSGLWIGLDALLFGWIGRRRAAEPAEVVEPVEATA